MTPPPLIYDSSNMHMHITELSHMGTELRNIIFHSQVFYVTKLSVPQTAWHWLSG